MRRVTRFALVAASVLAIGGTMLASADGPTEGVVISLSTESVAITITGGTLNFGGPHPDNADLQAHPQPNTNAVASATPPTIINSGNVPITSIQIEYGAPAGQEAACDGGTWSAGTSVGEDRFRLRAWASNETSFSQFNSNSTVVHPSNIAVNMLRPTDAPLNPEGGIPLLLQLHTPQPAVAGGNCSINLLVTAAAEG